MTRLIAAPAPHLPASTEAEGLTPWRVVPGGGPLPPAPLFLLLQLLLGAVPGPRPASLAIEDDVAAAAVTKASLEGEAFPHLVWSSLPTCKALPC